MNETNIQKEEGGMSTQIISMGYSVVLSIRRLILFAICGLSFVFLVLSCGQSPNSKMRKPPIRSSLGRVESVEEVVQKILNSEHFKWFFPQALIEGGKFCIVATNFSDTVSVSYYGRPVNFVGIADDCETKVLFNLREYSDSVISIVWSHPVTNAEGIYRFEYDGETWVMTSDSLRIL